MVQGVYVDQVFLPKINQIQKISIRIPKKQIKEVHGCNLHAAILLSIPKTHKMTPKSQKKLNSEKSQKLKF